ncbi:hypothetical protein Agub_g2032, partial [Astrephomene gubernaculifera]
MDPASVAEAAKLQHPSFLTTEHLQAALAALVPGHQAALLPASAAHPLVAGQALQPQAAEQPSPARQQQAKRKGGRTCADDATAAGAAPPARPPPIKHEVYEDLEEKFQQLQAEREPKRHRGNPKGYQIKSFCKNPACGKQLSGGRTNRCEHCGFDLASHRRNSQLERLIKTGPMAAAQVRTSLRDAANEVHVRTGGRAVVLTLAYIEGGGPAPAQAIAYGKPAAAFVEARKELITSFEAACREHFKEAQATSAPGHQQPQDPQQQQQQQQPAPLLPPPLSAPPGPQQPHLLLHHHSLPHPGTGPSATSSTSQLLASLPGYQPGYPQTSLPLPPLSFTSATAASASAATTTTCPMGHPSPLPQPLPASLLPLVDLDSIISATLPDPQPLLARCREARLSGEVLCRLPQGMQLTVLMQAGLLPGEAASVVVELETRLRLLQLAPQLPGGNLAGVAAAAPGAQGPQQQQGQQQAAGGVYGAVGVQQGQRPSAVVQHPRNRHQVVVQQQQQQQEALQLQVQPLLAPQQQQGQVPASAFAGGPGAGSAGGNTACGNGGGGASFGPFPYFGAMSPNVTPPGLGPSGHSGMGPLLGPLHAALAAAATAG